MKPELEAAVIAFYDAFYGPTADLDGGWEGESDARKGHFSKCMTEALQAIPLSRDLRSYRAARHIHRRNQLPDRGNMTRAHAIADWTIGFLVLGLILTPRWWLPVLLHLVR